MSIRYMSIRKIKKPSTEKVTMLTIKLKNVLDSHLINIATKVLESNFQINKLNVSSNRFKGLSEFVTKQSSKIL